jgi:hypothetical protein
MTSLINVAVLYLVLAHCCSDGIQRGFQGLLLLDKACK